MDEVRAFLNNPCPSRSQMVKLRGPLTGGVSISKHDVINELNRKEKHRHSLVPSGTDYAREIREKETDNHLRCHIERKEYESICEGLDAMDLDSFRASVANIGDLDDDAMKAVYSKYSFKKKEEPINKLAINAYKEKILNSIHSSEVLVIEGPTGCGKTTQVPQWILDDCVQRQTVCKIAVTQPRRIAAISIAKRVAHERGWDVGGLVGYQVALDNHTSSDTRISYMTTGVLLQKLVNSKTLNDYTHIILDEVHERGQDMDFLLLVVKKFLFTVSAHVKVVLMSATIRANLFTEYFKIPTPQGMQSSQCIKIENTNQMFNVKTFYLNDFKQFGAILQQCTPKNGQPSIMPEMNHLVVKLLNAFEIIDQKEDGYTNRSEADLPSVLIYLPGIAEIEELYLCLTNQTLRQKLAGEECTRYKWWVLPLHSTITPGEQVRVFKKAQPGFRKIILATNIAESSITVPDIKYVIDYCLMKTLIADEQTNFTSLQVTWAAKANCEQRAGRAGRVRDGRVYRLVNDKFYDSLPDEITPEIKRCPLERLVLLAKMLNMGPPSDILALAIDPPDLSHIHRTLLVLKEIGAMKQSLDGEWVSNDGEVTYVGRVMANLPLDVKVSKLIVLGYIFGCLEESIIIAAAMSVKNIFSSPFRDRLNAFNSRLTWADGSTSDCIAFMNVYKVWTHLRQTNYFKEGPSEGHWAAQFYVQIRSLRETQDMVQDLKQRISGMGIEPSQERSPWERNEIHLALKVIIAGAFYPQYFIQVSLDKSRERDAVKTLAGLDPRNTVYLKNFPENQPGELYAAAIKNVIYQMISEEPRVTFDLNSHKVFLTFNDGYGGMRQREIEGHNPTIPGQVVLPVYMALKARQLKMDVWVPLLPLDKAEARAQEMKKKEVDLDLSRMVPRLPDIDETYFPLKICVLNSMSDFWVQHDDESTAINLNLIGGALNKNPLIIHTGAVQCGDIFAAHHNREILCRAKILKLLPKLKVQVLFIDIGMISAVPTKDLYVLPDGLCRELPPLAMRCRLAGLAPPPLLDRHGNWSLQAIDFFRNLCRRRAGLIGKVYSVVQGVVAVDLLGDGGANSINQILLKNGYATLCEESYDSKMNHDLRETQNELNLSQKRAYNKQQTQLAYDQLRDIEPQSPKECISDVCLKGPYSPLESTLHTVMYASREKQVVIEWNSVNSVVLDTAPQETHERLIVAGNVGQNETHSKLTLRDTTLLPDIPGLPAIMALLFCPTAELRRDANGTRYVSALCGLGSNEDGMPFFPEHDLLLNIDADLSVEDIGIINHVRHLMDYKIFYEGSEKIDTINNEKRRRIPKIIRGDILKLLTQRRKHREPQSVPNAWEWRSVPEHELLEISVPEMLECTVLYPLHSPQELHPVSRECLMALKQGNNDLKMLVGRTPTSSAAMLTCKLCGTDPMPNHLMRIHLYSNGHIEKEEDLEMFHS